MHSLSPLHIDEQTLAACCTHQETMETVARIRAGRVNADGVETTQTRLLVCTLIYVCTNKMTCYK